MTSPVLALAILAMFVVVPLSFVFTGMAWVFARRYWRLGARLPVVIALTNTIALSVSLVVAVLAYRAMFDLPRLEATAEIAAISFLVLEVIPLLTTGYLIWLDRTSRRNGGPHPGDL